MHGQTITIIILSCIVFFLLTNQFIKRKSIPTECPCPPVKCNCSTPKPVTTTATATATATATTTATATATAPIAKPVSIPEPITPKVNTSYTNLGLLVHVDESKKNRYAKLFGRKTPENNSRWQYYAKLDYGNGTQVPILKDGKNCYSGGWPYCSVLYKDDAVSLLGESKADWKVSELWPISCDWQGDALSCSRRSL